MSARNTYGLVFAGACGVIALIWLAGLAGHHREPGLTDGPAGVKGHGVAGTSQRDALSESRAGGSLVAAGGDETGAGAVSAPEGGPAAGGARPAHKGVASVGPGGSAETAAGPGTGLAAESSLSPNKTARPGRNEELPIPESGLNDSPEMSTAYEEAMRRACETRFWDMRAGSYEEFLQVYPLSKYSPLVMANLAMAYAEMGRIEEARRTLEGAKLLAGNDPFVNFLDVMLADLDVRTQKFSQAQARLQAVMKRPIPGSLESEYATAGPRLLAPIRLAGVLAAQGRAEEADRLLNEACHTALDWTRDHSDVEWIPSYATLASYERVRLALTTRGMAEATPILNEVRQSLPDLAGKQGYGHVLELLALADYYRASGRDSGWKAPAGAEGG